MKALVSLAALAGLLAVAPAEAATPGFCNAYATRAVNEFEHRQQMPGCYKGANRRWHANWTAHYQWCLTAPGFEVKSEDNARMAQIHECSAEALDY